MQPMVLHLLTPDITISAIRMILSVVCPGTKKNVQNHVVNVALVRIVYDYDVAKFAQLKN